ncbi:hypothetical protein AGABI1DRAFT_133623 [Agaricus bisporus var. burnettii JB137-S8]|uniref:Uncharacterized protein n=1 Tax=Agaricus bisporus var. burnettii (strain JB137-S8 / ATCC MYA-4627 / FGSC 10392) TaxID=597362 RepID=K5XI62_AGABU|nr:uncharacterized protein AGABI1DRAFT_133623 [Agaricus bisporus var. burnettii JB137-S8]EKM74110.1 hypothetical protein AGABI1DRAFT_133623 [Agaricus bisporus var. burnettii JB137-S8]
MPRQKSFNHHSKKPSAARDAQSKGLEAGRAKKNTSSNKENAPPVKKQTTFIGRTSPIGKSPWKNPLEAEKCILLELCQNVTASTEAKLSAYC